MKSTYVQKIYGSYSFIDKDPVIHELFSLYQISGLKLSALAEKSGVTQSAIFNMFYGKTKRPQSATVEAVGRALGYVRFWHGPASEVVNFSADRKEVHSNYGIQHVPLATARDERRSRRKAARKARNTKASGANVPAMQSSAH